MNKIRKTIKVGIDYNKKYNIILLFLQVEPKTDNLKNIHLQLPF
jgi:hypothetical protein